MVCDYVIQRDYVMDGVTFFFPNLNINFSFYLAVVLDSAPPDCLGIACKLPANCLQIKLSSVWAVRGGIAYCILQIADCSGWLFTLSLISLFSPCSLSACSVLSLFDLSYSLSVSSLYSVSYCCILFYPILSSPDHNLLSFQFHLISFLYQNNYLFTLILYLSIILNILILINFNINTHLPSIL